MHKCKQTIKHLIKRGGALHDHEVLQLTVAALKVIVCCVSKVYKLVSLTRHPHVSVSVPVVINVEIKFIITKLSNVSANILVMFSIFTVNDVMHCPLKIVPVLRDYIQINNHLVEILPHETD